MQYTRYGYDLSGASNLEELQEKLRSSIMVRRLKSQVLTELPAKRRQVIEIAVDGSAVIIQREQNVWAAQQEQLEALKVSVELSKASEDPDEYRIAVEKLRSGAAIAFAEISKMRHETALAKVPYVIEHLENMIDNCGKVVCFCHHKDVVQKIKEAFGSGAVVLTGDTKMQDRQDAVDRFQKDPRVTLFIGTIMAAGVGLTLTAASNVVFAELDWVPGNVSQAEDRLHRIGQAESVLVQHLVLEGSLDANMAHTLVSKQNVIDRALDKNIEISALPEMQEPIIPGEPKERASSKSKIDSLASEIKENEIPEIHAAIKLLASLCNGATSVDGMGFNKIDTGVGKSLAMNGSLTKRQAALAKTICRKYKGQLAGYGVDLWGVE